LELGAKEGDELGFKLGLADGSAEGNKLGTTLGLIEGGELGERLGPAVGLAEGDAVVEGQRSNVSDTVKTSHVSPRVR
jgi:hypothetical protein